MTQYKKCKPRSSRLLSICSLLSLSILSPQSKRIDHKKPKNHRQITYIQTSRGITRATLEDNLISFCFMCLYFLSHPGKCLLLLLLLLLCRYRREESKGYSDLYLFLSHCVFGKVSAAVIIEVLQNYGGQVFDLNKWNTMTPMQLRCYQPISCSEWSFHIFSFLRITHFLQPVNEEEFLILGVPAVLLASSRGHRELPLVKDLPASSLLN